MQSELNLRRAPAAWYGPQEPTSDRILAKTASNGIRVETRDDHACEAEVGKRDAEGWVGQRGKGTRQTEQTPQMQLTFCKSKEAPPDPIAEVPPAAALTEDVDDAREAYGEEEADDEADDRPPRWSKRGGVHAQPSTRSHTRTVPLWSALASSSRKGSALL
jgi:hypothetical protein